MRFEHIFARLFNMTEETWEKHANPWSVWTRYICLPLFVVAIGLYPLIGLWNLALIAAIILWVWFNPRIFGKPKSTNNWASKSVLGERVLLSAPKKSIPQHHQKAITVLKFVMSLGTISVLVGLVLSHNAYIWSGVSIVVLAKSWFLDRMVWLYEDMSRTHPEYQKWLY